MTTSTDWAFIRGYDSREGSIRGRLDNGTSKFQIFTNGNWSGDDGFGSPTTEWFFIYGRAGMQNAVRIRLNAGTPELQQWYNGAFYGDGVSSSITTTPVPLLGSFSKSGSYTMLFELSNGAKSVSHFTPAQGTAGEAFTTLALPVSFPVTLQRSGTRYRILETAQAFEDLYTGTTYYVDDTRADDSGDGLTPATAKKTINGALAVASALDKLSFAPGEYATPTSNLKQVACIAPDGGVRIGRFNSLSTAQVDASGTLWNVDDVDSGETFMGFVRIDGTLIQGVAGSAHARTNDDALDDHSKGIQTVFAGGASANFGTGTAETLPTLIAADAIRAWTDADTQTFNIPTGVDVFIGEGITICSHATNVITCAGTAKLYMAGEAYGGADSTVSHPGSGQVIQIGAKYAGAVNDNIDYRGTVTAVEANITSHWPGREAAANASTLHDSAVVLTVGSSIKGGYRTINDINASKRFIFSTTIADALGGEKKLLAAGAPTVGSETMELVYGDLTFEDNFSDGGLTNLFVDTDATSTAIELTDAWPYGSLTAPVNTMLPALSGTSQVGQTLTCSTGTWSGNPTPSFSYQWQIDGVDVGTNQNTYVPQVGDIDGIPTCEVTATNSQGSATAETSAGSAVIAAAGFSGWSDIPNVRTIHDVQFASSLYDAVSGGSVVSFNSGGVAEVQRWEDQTANNKHFTQATLSEAPDYNRTENSKQVLNFWDGASHHMDSAIDLTDPATYPLSSGMMFIWIGLADKAGSDASPNYLFDQSNGAIGLALRLEVADMDFLVFDTVEGNVSVADAGVYATGTATCIIGVVNETGVYLYQDGVLRGSTEPAGGLTAIEPASGTPLVLMAEHDESDEADGSCFAFVTAAHSPSNSQLNDYFGKANADWGITVSTL